MAAGEDGGQAGRLRFQGEFSAQVFWTRRALFLAFFSGTRRVPLLFLCFSWCAVFFCAAKCFSQVFLPCRLFMGVLNGHI